MLTIDLDDHIAQLQARRCRLVAKVARVDAEIEATQIVISSWESLTQSQSDPQSQSAGATRGSSSRRGPTSADHPAVRALCADDLRPYQRFKADLHSLALRYAELHDGEIAMKDLVPLAVRLGLSKAEYYKNAWGGVYRALQRNSRFIQVTPPGEGRFRVVTVADGAAEADAA